VRDPGHGARRQGAEEARENLRHLVGRDADAGTAHAEPGMGLGRRTDTPMPRLSPEVDRKNKHHPFGRSSAVFAPRGGLAAQPGAWCVSGGLGT
jgi:hypothetical protein